jgi:hypothetical protein
MKVLLSSGKVQTNSGERSLLKNLVGRCRLTLSDPS